METKENYKKSLWEYYRNLSEEDKNVKRNYANIRHKNMPGTSKGRKKYENY